MTEQSNEPKWYFPANPELQVNSVSINSDGKRCVFGTSNEFGNGVFDVYCMDDDKNVLWKHRISDEPVSQGVFWVSISGDGKYVAAGGKTTEKGSSFGFLMAFCADTGKVLLDKRTPTRVNQVSLNHDGTRLLSVDSHNVQLWERDGNRGFELRDTHDLYPYVLNSAVISQDGKRAVVSGRIYDDSSAGARQPEQKMGAVFSFEAEESGLKRQQTAQLKEASMRVAVVADGDYWAAALHDGTAALFSKDKPCEPIWTYQPDISELHLAYGLDVTITREDEILCAVGANTSGTTKGAVYLLRTSIEAAAKGKQPECMWTQRLLLSANPGVSLDEQGKYVTATDGQPIGDSGKESIGHFYLFDGATGVKQWQYETKKMNWPMMIAQDASAVFAGSDDGSVYYWKLSD